LVGLEVDIGHIRRSGQATIAVSHASITVPFLLGMLVALGIYPHVATADVTFTSFALFIGVSMSITAFPVLARILTDQGVNKTPLGTMALACAAVGDVTAWCLLALAVGVAQADPLSALRTFLLTIVYIAVMLSVVRR